LHINILFRGDAGRAASLAGDAMHACGLQSAATHGLAAAHWSAEQADLEISVKNRGDHEQKVTLEAWLPRWPSLVATSADRELDRALIDVRKGMIRQIEHEKTNRALHKDGLRDVGPPDPGRCAAIPGSFAPRAF
jgi:hypothetical protein